MGPGWGADLSVKLTSSQAKSVVNTPMPNGQAIKFLFRYVSLSAPLRAGDIDPGERDSILGTGIPLILVQHVEYPSWIASAANGTEHGNAAGEDAKQIQYPAGAHVFLDLEGVKNVGGPVDEYVTCWAYAVQAYGFSPALYVGYACGITPDILAQHTEFTGFWSDFGPRTLPSPGFMCKQFAQVMHCNVPVDPDKCYADMLGRTLIGMGIDDGDPKPHVPNVETKAPPVA